MSLLSRGFCRFSKHALCNLHIQPVTTLSLTSVHCGSTVSSINVALNHFRMDAYASLSRDARRTSSKAQWFTDAAISLAWWLWAGGNVYCRSHSTRTAPPNRHVARLGKMATHWSIRNRKSSRKRPEGRPSCRRIVYLKRLLNCLRKAALNCRRR
jgi:hypothetical protein